MSKKVAVAPVAVAVAAVKAAPAAIVFADVKPGDLIPDGTHFRSVAGTHCYKVPKPQYDDVVSYGLDEFLVKVDAWALDKIQRAFDYTTARLIERGPKDAQLYLIFPVTKAKQRDALGLYMSRLWAFRNKLQAVRASRSAETQFGAPAMNSFDRQPVDALEAQL